MFYSLQIYAENSQPFKRKGASGGFSARSRAACGQKRSHDARFQSGHSTDFQREDV